MTREDLIKLLWWEITIAAKPSREIEGIPQAADKILSRISKEEFVIGRGVVGAEWTIPWPRPNINGKKGRLVFIEEK